MPDPRFPPPGLGPVLGVAARSRIMTSRGQVEAGGLVAGDAVLTLSRHGRRLKPVRQVLVTAQPGPMLLIRAGAFGPGVPQRDLVVGPDLPVSCEGGLVPARLLLGDRAVIEAPREACLLIRLAQPDILVAEGCQVATEPAEAPAPERLAAIRAMLALRLQPPGSQAAALLDRLLGADDTMARLYAEGAATGCRPDG